MSHAGPWQNLSAIRAELDDNTIRGLSITGTVIAFTADYKLSRKLGFSQQHAISIVNSLYSDITPWLTLGNKWGVSEETMVTSVLPLLKSSTTLSIILAGTILQGPSSILTLIAVAAIYLLSQFSNYFFLLLLKPCTPNLPLPEHMQKFLQLLKQVAIAVISGIIAKKLVLPIFAKVGNQFTLSEVEENTDPPYEVLSISPFSTDDEIKATCRRLKGKLHPDANKNETELESNTARFMKVGNACDQLLRKAASLAVRLKH